LIDPASGPARFRSTGHPASPDGRAQGEEDLIATVLRSIRLTGGLLFLVDAHAPWVTQAPAARAFAAAMLPGVQHLLSFHIVTHGTCWAGIVGEAKVRLEAGDVLVIPHGDPYLLASAPDLRSSRTPEQEVDFFRQMAAGGLPPIVQADGGGSAATSFLCGFLGCDLQLHRCTLAALPRAICLRRSTMPSQRIDRLVALACDELHEQRPGSRPVLLRLSELLFVEALRCYLQSAPAAHGGWLAAVGDPHVARALALLHARAAHPWTLAALARESRTSRSVLAARFVRLVGRPPMQYLTEWRMQRASTLLADGQQKLAAVAAEAGYSSEAAFSRAFKRFFGVAPGTWQKAARASE
jgi:AraC-like DNA-binding protein